MQIFGFGQIHQAHSIKPTQRFESAHETRGAGETSSAYGPDRLEISSEARQALAAGNSAPVRADRIAEIRSQIAAGTYETPEKLELALERMFGDLG
ncbi:MAG TPA: hypothetical protein DCQ98_18465 [Planctomycetaceae bacterium]|nr:hypothetical protein [Planctomycetaceae bacterium]HRE99644.1 flagellar biosynthesis anti-sigma factor FlgM [Pirellulaceae bacterium]